MSSFICEHCGKVILDTSNGYITGCEHYPTDHHYALCGRYLSEQDTLRCLALAIKWVKEGTDDWEELMEYVRRFDASIEKEAEE